MPPKTKSVQTSSVEETAGTTPAGRSTGGFSQRTSRFSQDARSASGAGRGRAGYRGIDMERFRRSVTCTFNRDLLQARAMIDATLQYRREQAAGTLPMPSSKGWNSSSKGKIASRGGHGPTSAESKGKPEPSQHLHPPEQKDVVDTAKDVSDDVETPSWADIVQRDSQSPKRRANTDDAGAGTSSAPPPLKKAKTKKKTPREGIVSAAQQKASPMANPKEKPPMDAELRKLRLDEKRAFKKFSRIRNALGADPVEVKRTGLDFCKRIKSSVVRDEFSAAYVSFLEALAARAEYSTNHPKPTGDAVASDMEDDTDTPAECASSPVTRGIADRMNLVTFQEARDSGSESDSSSRTQSRQGLRSQKAILKTFQSNKTAMKD